MTIPFRTRRRLKQLGTGLMILLMVLVLIWMCWVIWLERYVVYSDQGASLRWDRDPHIPSGELAVPPESQDTVGIFYNEGQDSVVISTELTRMSGYYADTDALTDIPAVRAQIQELPSDVPIMLDVKNSKGNFYYSTSVGKSNNPDIDTGAMNSLIADLALSERYLIARLPAFRDWEFGLNNVNSGLFLPSGMGLWMDEDGCYWLNPDSSTTTSYLMHIVSELKELGFDEVVFTEFRFPYGDYVFDGDQSIALAKSAQTLVTGCSTDSFTVSFLSNYPAFPVPEGRSRLYLTGFAATDVESCAESANLPDPVTQLVFLTESSDTRYETYGVLRPLDTAH